MKTENKQQQTVTTNTPKYGAPTFRVGEEVFLVAFLQGKPVTYYVCKGIIEKTPHADERRIYKIKITAVGEKAIGGKAEKVPPQACLLNRTITKRENELNKTMAPFMLPKHWILASSS